MWRGWLNYIDQKKTLVGSVANFHIRKEKKMEEKINNPTNEDAKAQRQRKMNRWIPFLSGLVVGGVLTGLIMWVSMPKMMLVVRQSRYDTIEETVQQLKAAIEANGWANLAIRDLNETMAKYGVHMDEQVRVVELCNANYSKKVLTTNSEVSTLMPCAWGVYKGEDGKIYISGMNMGLMGKMFGGNIAKVMGGMVSKDEKQMLKGVIQ